MGIKRTELIRQIDLWPSKYFLGTKLDEKCKNIETQIFLCIFGKILCILKVHRCPPR